MNPQDQTAVSACRKGDLDRFTELYDRYFEPIYRFIYFKTQHCETAEDLTSQTFLKALEHIERFKDGSFQAWLYRIARNTVIDHYRTTRPQSDIEDAWDLDDGTNPARDAELRDLVGRVRGSLSQLPADQRDVVLLRLWDDRPYREIAEIMGKSEANCKVMFSRAVAKLRTEPLSALLALIAIMLTSHSSTLS
jgi:RNA polymerase sigma factor (sigma-70 family)